MRILCGIFAYIFDMQWIKNVPTACSLILSHIYYSILFCVLLILYAGISIMNIVNYDTQILLILYAGISIMNIVNCDTQV